MRNTRQKILHAVCVAVMLSMILACCMGLAACAKTPNYTLDITADSNGSSYAKQTYTIGDSGDFTLDITDKVTYYGWHYFTAKSSQTGAKIVVQRDDGFNPGKKWVKYSSADAEVSFTDSSKLTTSKKYICMTASQAESGEGKKTFKDSYRLYVTGKKGTKITIVWARFMDDYVDWDAKQSYCWTAKAPQGSYIANGVTWKWYLTKNDARVLGKILADKALTMREKYSTVTANKPYPSISQSLVKSVIGAVNDSGDNGQFSGTTGEQATEIVGSILTSIVSSGMYYYYFDKMCTNLGNDLKNATGPMCVVFRYDDTYAENYSYSLESIKTHTVQIGNKSYTLYKMYKAWGYDYKKSGTFSNYVPLFD